MKLSSRANQTRNGCWRSAFSAAAWASSTALSSISPCPQLDFSAKLADVQWVSNGYMLALASLILLGGGMGDRLGTLRAFRVGMLLFVAASVACGLSNSTTSLIASRFIQGAAAALLMPTSLALISQVYKGQGRGKAIGAWSAAGGVMMALGPPMGGWLVDDVGWRSIFFINVPIAAVALLISYKVGILPRAKPSGRLDVTGSGLAVLALGLLTFGLIEFGAGAVILGAASLLLALPVAALFLYVEAKARSPLVPLRLFRDRDFSAANALTVSLYAGVSGALFMLPFSLVKAHGYTPTAAGMAFLPFSVILGMGSRFTGGLAAKTGPRLPLIVGPAITALGFVVLGAFESLPTYWLGYFPGLVIIASGMTLTIPALTTLIFDSSPDADSGTASAINNAAARTGGLLAVAALGIAFGKADATSLSTEGVTVAYRLVMYCAAVAALASALCAVLVSKPRETRGDGA